MKSLVSRPTKYYFLLVMAALLVYWPLSLHLFSLKNDAVIYYLPWRYHVSEAIRHGYFPFWSPYLYTGLPLHADVQSGVWNPLVMTISLFTTYDMSILQLETLCYIVIGMTGFFKLARWFSFDETVCLVLALAYGASGYLMDDCSFTTWMAASAYLPFSCLYFLRSLREPGLRNTLLFALSSSLLILSGYPSFFIQLAYLFAVIFVVHSIRYVREKKYSAALFSARHIAMAAIVTALITSPAILSYLSFTGYYERGQGLSAGDANSNPFNILNSISFLFPPAGYKIEAANDITSRNTYIGLLPLVFIVYSFFSGISRQQKWIMAITLFFFLFSLGNATPLRAFCYHLLPGMDIFRHPANSRIFSIAGLILLSGFGMQSYFRLPKTGRLRYTLIAFSVVCGIAITASLVTGSLQLPENLSVKTIKEFKDQASLSFYILVSACLQLLFLIIALIWINKLEKRIYWLSLANFIFLGFLVIPFTMVSQVPAKEMNAFVKSFPPGFPLKEAIKPLVTEDLRNKNGRYGYPGFYAKQLTIQNVKVSPTLNTAYRSLWMDAALIDSLSGKPAFFIDNKGKLELIKFSPNRFEFNYSTDTASVVYVIQQYHHNWKARVSGSEVKIETYNAFMKIPVGKGSGIIVFAYRPRYIVTSAIIALLTIAFSIVILFINRKTPRTL